MQEPLVLQPEASNLIEESHLYYTTPSPELVDLQNSDSCPEVVEKSSVTGGIVGEKCRLFGRRFVQF